MDQSYAADVCMEPLFWFVDNFTYLIGPVNFLSLPTYILNQLQNKNIFAVVCYRCDWFDKFHCWYSLLDRSSLLVEPQPLCLHLSSHNRTLALN